jgi:hypothetical protein
MSKPFPLWSSLGLAAALALAAPACASSHPKPAPAEDAALPDKDEVDDGATSGVKPHHVACDPNQPDMPCTPDTIPPELQPRL